MTHDELLSLCERVVSGRQHAAFGRITCVTSEAADPVREILRSFRRAEISESEKNSLLSLVCDDEDRDFPAETSCVADVVADELAGAFDDDDVG